MVYVAALTKATFTFGAFFGQNVVFTHFGTFDFAGWSKSEAFFGCALGFHFRHLYFLQVSYFKLYFADSRDFALLIVICSSEG